MSFCNAEMQQEETWKMIIRPAVLFMGAEMEKGT